jgi:hypothetical protein
MAAMSDIPTMPLSAALKEALANANLRHSAAVLALPIEQLAGGGCLPRTTHAENFTEHRAISTACLHVWSPLFLRTTAIGVKPESAAAYVREINAAVHLAQPRMAAGHSALELYEQVRR